MNAPHNLIDFNLKAFRQSKNKFLKYKFYWCLNNNSNNFCFVVRQGIALRHDQLFFDCGVETPKFVYAEVNLWELPFKIQSPFFILFRKYIFLCHIIFLLFSFRLWYMWVVCVYDLGWTTSHTHMSSVICANLIQINCNLFERSKKRRKKIKKGIESFNKTQKWLGMRVYANCLSPFNNSFKGN